MSQDSDRYRPPWDAPASTSVTRNYDGRGGLRTDGGTSDSGRYRVFCAYGPHYREPGCGWETTADTEREARRLAERHTEGQTHTADYERYVDTGSSQSEDFTGGRLE